MDENDLSHYGHGLRDWEDLDSVRGPIVKAKLFTAVGHVALSGPSLICAVMGGDELADKLRDLSREMFLRGLKVQITIEEVK